MGNLDDAFSITLAVTIVVTVGFVQEYRSEKSLEALSKLVPHYAHSIRGSPVPKFRSDRSGPAKDNQNDIEMSVVQDRSTSTSSSLFRGATTIPASKLVVGDLVIFATGDRIPADIRITTAADLSIDESNLTGENEPVRKQTEALNRGLVPASIADRAHSWSPIYASPAAGTVGTDIRLNEQTNIAFMGTLVREGHGSGLVIGTGAGTEFGGISASLQGIESPRTPLQLSMDRLGQELSYMSFAVITLIVFVGLWQGRQLLDMFTIGVSLAVAAIPEGLPIIVTVTLALGVLRMAKQGASVRRLPSVETLGSVNVVCSDKTGEILSMNWVVLQWIANQCPGTLTLNHMTVTKIWHFDAPSPIDVNRDMASSVPDSATRMILRIGNIANNARLAHAHLNSPATASSAAIMSSTLGNDSSTSSAKSRWVGQPTDVAMLDLLGTFGEDEIRDRIVPRSTETPFSSERKWMGVVSGANQQHDHNCVSDTAYIKGAVDQVLRRCDTYLSKDGREIILDEPRRQAAMAAAEKMAGEGLRVLAFASGSNRDALKSGRSTQMQSRSSTPRPKLDGVTLRQSSEEVYEGLIFAGLVGMNDPPRKDVHKSIQKLTAGGVKVIMITGDAEATALAVARKLGMPLSVPRPSDVPGYKPYLTGTELDRMSQEEVAATGTTIFARTSPEHKMKIVRALQSRGDVVAMTGDGVNDAPALKQADIGISMGLLGTDVAKEAADMILTDDDFSTILGAIEEGKGIFYNIQNFLTFQLSTSVAALSLVLLSTFMGFKNPLNTMQILWISELQHG